MIKIHNLSSRYSQIISTIAIFIITLLPRLLPPHEFITADELIWVHRSIHFRGAVLRGDWASTYQTGHPGVTTMWLGALGLSVSDSDKAELARLDQMRVGQDADDLRSLARLLPKAKLLFPWVHALLLTAMYLLLTQLFGKSAAFFAALLAATAPFHIALSRVLHVDALLADFMCLAVLGFLVYLTPPSNSPQCPPSVPPKGGEVIFLPSGGELEGGKPSHISLLLLSGVFSALAVLTKTPGLFLAPFLSLLYLVATVVRLSKNRDWRAEIRNLRAVIFALCIALIVTVGLFPALLAQPVEAVRAALGQTIEYAVDPNEVAFFMGEVAETPGGAVLYPVVWWFQTTPLTVFGILCLLIFAGYARIANQAQRRETSPNSSPKSTALSATLWLIIYAVGFAAFLTIGAKNKPRYLIPTITALDLVAGVGIAYLVDFVGDRLPTARAMVRVIVTAIVLLVTFATIIVYRPYYLSYYNPLAGGSAAAVKTIVVGWGEGLEQAAEYLNELPDAEVVASHYSSTFIPFFDNSVVSLEHHDPAMVDYLMFYISREIQRRTVEEVLEQYYGKETPVKVIRIHGIDYVLIYRNKHFREILDYIEPRAAEDDAIVLPVPSNFHKYDRGALPYYTVIGDEDEVAAQLAEIAAPHRRVWYIAYPDTGEKVTFYLQTRCRRISEQELSGATVYSYDLPASAAFAPPPLQDAFADFSGKFQLLQYRVTPTAAWQRDIGVNLNWQMGEDAEDYHAFLHLVDAQGHRWGQFDAPLSSRYAVPLEMGTPAGNYELLVGMYRWSTGERLTLADGTSTVYSLGKVRVESAPVMPSIASAEIPTPLAHEFNAGLRLLGYDLPSALARTGESLPLSLFWQAARPLDDDTLTGQIALKDVAGQVIAETSLDLPAQWTANEFIRGQCDLLLPPEITDDAAELWLIVDGEELLLTEIAIDVVTRSFTKPAVANEQVARLGDAVDFIGYEIGEIDATVPITLYWQARQPLETSYTVFVHVLNDAWQVVAQRDAVPMNGMRPTTGWVEGEYIVDAYEIPLETDIAVGEYKVEIGMYDAVTGQRLPVYNNLGNEVLERRVLLTRQVEVVR